MRHALSIAAVLGWLVAGPAIADHHEHKAGDGHDHGPQRHGRERRDPATAALQLDAGQRGRLVAETVTAEQDCRDQEQHTTAEGGETSILHVQILPKRPTPGLTSPSVGGGSRGATDHWLQMYS